MRSKTLISYQKGYCGQPADIETMKPREARAYCLGVGHVAAGTLPLGSGAEVLAALTTRRRRDGGEVAEGTYVQLRAPSASGVYFGVGERTFAHLETIRSSGQSRFRVLLSIDNSIKIGFLDGSSCWVDAADFTPAP
jgi:hypothetical protein